MAKTYEFVNVDDVSDIVVVEQDSTLRAVEDFIADIEHMDYAVWEGKTSGELQIWQDDAEKPTSTWMVRQFIPEEEVAEE